MGAMHGTRAALLGAADAVGNEAEQGKHLGQAERGTHGGEVDARPGRCDGALLVGRLPHGLARPSSMSLGAM